MKKLAAITLCLMMGLFVLAGCGGAEAEPSPYAGTWTATTASYGGIEMSVDTLFDEMTFVLFDEMTFVLENGGKVTMNIDGEANTGKWTESENGFTVEDEFEFIVDGTNASMDYDGVTINFEQKAE